MSVCTMPECTQTVEVQRIATTVPGTRPIEVHHCRMCDVRHCKCGTYVQDPTVRRCKCGRHLNVASTP